MPAWLCLKLSPPFNHLSAASRPQPVFGRAYLPKKIKILQKKHSSPSTLSSSATAVKYKPTAHVDLMREKCIVGALAVSCMSVTGCSCWPTTNCKLYTNSDVSPLRVARMTPIHCEPLHQESTVPFSWQVRVCAAQICGALSCLHS